MTEHSSKAVRWAWIAALVVGGGTLFFAWDRFGFGGNSALAGGQGLVDEIVGSPPQWTLGDETDPMTDEQIVSAHRQIEADGFLIDTTIACRPTSGAIIYTFATFEADRSTPAEFVVDVVGSSHLTALHSAEIRADGAKARVLKNGAPRYTNTFEIADNANLTLGSAGLLTIKLYLKQGEPLFRIDQADEIIADVIGRCTQAISAIEEEQEAKAARPRHPNTQIFTITDIGLRTKSLSRSGIGVEEIAGVCIGDQIAVKNDASQAVVLLGSVYASDDTAEIGSVTPGRTLTFPARNEGKFIITSLEHPNIGFRYNVAQCS